MGPQDGKEGARKPISIYTAPETWREFSQCGWIAPGCWKKESEVAQSCLTLCDPMDYSPLGSSVHGIFQARVLEGVAISFSRGSSRPRDWTQVSHVAGRRFTNWATREAHLDVEGVIISHFAEGKTGPGGKMSTETVQLRPSWNPSLLTGKVKALSEVEGIWRLIQLSQFYRWQTGAQIEKEIIDLTFFNFTEKVSIIHWPGSSPHRVCTHPSVVMVTMVYQKAAGMLVKLVLFVPFSA